MPHAAAPRRILRESLRLDRAGFAPGRAFHNAIGIGAPLAVGVATGRLLEGVAVAGGALVVGFADLGGVYSLRAKTMLVASVMVAASTLVGLVTGGNDWLAVLLMGVWGFGGGLMVALGQAPAFVGLLSGLALLLAADFPADGPEALRRSALVLAGGLLQTVLAVVVWPIRPHGPERRAVAEACGALALSVVEEPDAFERAGAAAEATLAAGRSWSRSGVDDLLVALLAELEAVHAELEALRLERGSPAVELELGEAARILRDAGDALRRGRPPSAVVEDASGAPAGLTPEAAQVLAALRRRLRTIAGLATEVARVPRTGASAGPARRLPPSDSPLEVLRANLTVRSTAFRHALRLGVTLAVAVSLYRVFPLGRGYWVPLTVIFVLRPDYGATFLRGAQRYAGTLLGVGVTTAVAALLSPGDWVDTALVIAFAWLTYATFYANYGLFTASITGLIVFLVAYEGGSTYDLALDRLLDTVIGGALALVAFALWPTWEGTGRVDERVAAVLDADRVYLGAVLQAAAGGDGREPVDRARSSARLARSNAEASVERALQEPARAREDVGADAAVLAASRTLGAAALAIDARVVDGGGTVPAVPEVAERLDETLAELAAAQRDRRTPVLPARPPAAESVPDSTPAWLVEALDRVLDSIDAIARPLELSAAAPGAAAARGR